MIKKLFIASCIAFSFTSSGQGGSSNYSFSDLQSKSRNRWMTKTT